MKNESENKTPQATYSGDAMGRFYGLGTAWGFLYLNIPPDRQGQPKRYDPDTLPVNQQGRK
jgi:hypothetical protein